MLKKITSGDSKNMGRNKNEGTGIKEHTGRADSG
jgi:hypothetical protein